MDDGVSKSVIIGIVAFIVLAVAGVVMYLFNKGKGIANQGVANMDVLVKNLDDSRIADYPHNSNVPGSFVISAIKTLAKDDLTIIVRTKLNSKDSGNEKSPTAYNEPIYNVQSPSDINYIQTTELFHVKHVINQSGVLVALVFCQVGSDDLEIGSVTGLCPKPDQNNAYQGLKYRPK